MSSIPLFDTAHQTDGIEGDILEAWESILKSGRYVSGLHVNELEVQFAAVHQVAEAVAVSNGTVALELVLRALGVRHGDEVIVPTNSFVATAAAVSNVGGVPIFADIEVDTANIDPLHVESLITPRTVGLIGVHLNGNPCDVVALEAICDRHALFFVEDAAQAHVAAVFDSPVGGFGEAASFSFYPGKNLGAPGEGGMVTTNDRSLAATVRRLRNHGQEQKNVSEIIGTNARMSELVASTLTLKLSKLSGWSQARRGVASTYDKLFADCEDVSVLTPKAWALPVYHLYPVEVARRDWVRDQLLASEIETGIHYPTPIHMQPAYAQNGFGRGALPRAERRAERLMTLPVYPGLSTNQVEMVANTLVSVCEVS